jgi:type I restriction enzyme S subunit
MSTLKLNDGSERTTTSLDAPESAMRAVTPSFGRELPTAWKWLSLSDVCLKVQDGTHFSPKEQFANGAYKYITAKNIKPWGLDLSELTYVSEKTHREISKRCNPEKGDVLYIKDGVTTGIATVNTLDEQFSLLSSVALLKPRREIIDPYFLKYYLNSPEGFRSMTGQMTGTAIKRLILRKIKEARVPVAPIPEQHRIVAEIEKHFRRLDAGVASLKRIQAALKRYRASVLKAACEGRLVPPEAELARKEWRSYETGEQLLARILAKRRKNGSGEYKEAAAQKTSNLRSLPEGWIWATLGELANVKGGITKDQKRKHAAPARSIPYLRVANVQRGYLDLSEIKEIMATEDEIHELRLMNGDVLFNEGGDRDKLGRGWIWSGELSECIHQNHVFRARLLDAALSPKLVSWYANTFGQKFFFDEGKHTTNLASISMTRLKGLPIPIPPPIEQVRIVGEVERRLSVVEELEAVVAANLKRAERLRQSVLNQAFRGELLRNDSLPLS